MTVGQRLVRARRKLKKRQADIAAEVGRAQPTVHAWESDQCLPGRDCLHAVADAYHLDVVDLLPPRKKRPKAA